MIKKVVRVFLYIYRYCLGPALSLLFNNGKSWCRFSPSCSEYISLAFAKYSFKKAAHLSIVRIRSCHSQGTLPEYDPLP